MLILNVFKNFFIIAIGLLGSALLAKISKALNLAIESNSVIRLYFFADFCVEKLFHEFYAHFCRFLSTTMYLLILTLGVS